MIFYNPQVVDGEVFAFVDSNIEKVQFFDYVFVSNDQNSLLLCPSEEYIQYVDELEFEMIFHIESLDFFSFDEVYYQEDTGPKKVTFEKK